MALLHDAQLVDGGTPYKAATQTTVADIDSKIPALGPAAKAASTPVTMATDQPAIPVSAAALPLPAGAATQTTLASIDTKTPALGAAAKAAAVPVTMATDQPAIPVSAAALPLPAGAATQATLASIDTKTPALGAAAKAAAVPVTMATDQPAIPVSAAALPLPAGAATEVTVAAINTKTPALGAAAKAASVPVTMATDQPGLDVKLVDNYGFEAEFTPMGDARAVEPFRLVGSAFEGTTVDTNFWTAAAAGAGAAISQANGQQVVATGTAVGATVTVFSVRRARYVGGTSLRYRSVIRLDAGTANNRRRWGAGWGSVAMPTVTDGAFFELDGTTFSIVTLKGGVAARVSSGAFNGGLGAVYDPGITVQTYEVYWTNSKVYFVVNGTILHTVSATTTTWSATMSLHAFADSLNAAAATSVAMEIRSATIYILGAVTTATVWFYESAAVAAVVKKRGPGKLHSVINGDNAAATVTFYDALTATNPILVIDLTKVFGTIVFDRDFYTGLTYTTTGAPKINVGYE